MVNIQRWGRDGLFFGMVRYEICTEWVSDGICTAIFEGCDICTAMGEQFYIYGYMWKMACSLLWFSKLVFIQRCVIDGIYTEMCERNEICRAMGGRWYIHGDGWEVDYIQRWLRDWYKTQCVKEVRYTKWFSRFGVYKAMSERDGIYRVFHDFRA